MNRWIEILILGPLDGVTRLPADRLRGGAVDAEGIRHVTVRGPVGSLFGGRKQTLVSHLRLVSDRNGEPDAALMVRRPDGACATVFELGGMGRLDMDRLLVLGPGSALLLAGFPAGYHSLRMFLLGGHT